MACSIRKLFPQEVILELKQTGVKGREGPESIVMPVCIYIWSCLEIHALGDIEEGIQGAAVWLWEIKMGKQANWMLKKESVWSGEIMRSKPGSKGSAAKKGLTVQKKIAASVDWEA